MKTREAIFLTTAGAFLILTMLYPQMNAFPGGPTIFERDITFCKVDGIDLKLDLCRPSAGTAPFPALVYIPNSTWGLDESFTKTECASLLSEAASRGYVAVEIEHRRLTYDWDTRR